MVVGTVPRTTLVVRFPFSEHVVEGSHGSKVILFVLRVCHSLLLSLLYFLIFVLPNGSHVNMAANTPRILVFFLAFCKYLAFDSCYWQHWCYFLYALFGGVEWWRRKWEMGSLVRNGRNIWKTRRSKSHIELKWECWAIYMEEDSNSLS